MDRAEGFYSDFFEKVEDSLPILMIVSIVVFLAGLLGYMIWGEVVHANGIQAGYIYQKKYEPSSDITSFQTVGSGKTAVTVPVHTHTDEKFKLWIRQSDDKGGYKTNYIYVPQDIWNQAKVGEWFDGDCMCFDKK